MESFLNQVSEYLLKISDGDPGKICVVFPNRRAGLFLRKELAAQLKGPVWSPEIFSIEDLIWKISGLRKADTGEQLLLLYRIYVTHQEEKAEPFDAFCKWAPTLLNDFGEIDNYLKEAKDVFINLADIKEIEQWSLSEPELTDFQKQYLHFWDSIGSWYHEFRSELESKGIAYYGLAASHASKRAVEAVKDSGWKKVIFAGFNALSPAEHRIISSLIDAGIADTLWDADRYYVEDIAQEAGKYFRQNKEFMLAKRNDEFAFSNIGDRLSTDEKNIVITGVARNVSQAKAAAQFLADLPAESSGSAKTAIVLADESLLFPLLHSLPFDGPVNVTMGYPMKISTAASLFNALILLQENLKRFDVRTSKKELKFYHADISRLIRHPLFSALSGSAELSKCWKEFLSRSNAIFCAASQLKRVADEKNIPVGNALLLFTPWDNEDDAITNIKDIINACRNSLSVNEHGFSMEVEFLFQLDQLLNRAQTLTQKYNRKGDLKIFRVLMEQQIASKLIPFSGEPVQGLQVMGLLETRVLDFENVILLSANENVLPAGKSNSTFILHELRRYFGLPTFSDRDSVFAYHFYHLLHRAKNIFITYNTDSVITVMKEKCRYLTQLLHELPRINKNADIRETIFDPGLHSSENTNNEITIPKDDAVMNAVAAFAERGFSPSSINNYISCHLKFYLHNVLGIREHEEVEEAVDARSLGTIMHKALENLYKPVEGKITDAVFYDSAIRKAEDETDKAFADVFKDEGARSGKNLLAKTIALKYITGLLKKEKQELKNGASEILSLETEMKADFTVNGRVVKIKGTADRIEKRNGMIRVIDYKTGNVKDGSVTVKDPALLKDKTELDKALQLIMYGSLYRKTHSTGLPITSGIISFRRHKDGIILCKFGEDNILTGEKLDQFEEVLAEIIGSVFDPLQPFDQTTETDRCQFCDFNKMCGREKDEKR